MPRHFDNAPIRYTCPIINDIIGKMESVEAEATYISKHLGEDISGEVDNILCEIADAIQRIEDVREANNTLRDWGNEEYRRAESAETERDEAIRDKEDLEEEIDKLKERIKELE